jgi:broad specificity phosphatase PhoE
MNTSPQIWLIRHGETAWSRTGQHTGRTDLPLLPEAEPELKALKPHLKHAFVLVLSSPLQRARQTAKLVGFDSFEQDDNLMEWDYGAYDGKTRDEIQKLVPGWSIWTHGAPQGEMLEEVARRARKVIERARAASGDVALISHGHMLRVLAACWLGLPPANGEHFALSAGSISVLGYEYESPVVAQWNWLPDLPTPEVTRSVSRTIRETLPTHPLSPGVAPP